MKNITLTLIIALFSLTSVKAQNCNKIKTTFNSYNEAIKILNTTKFTLGQQINTPESFWIKSATFKSCDKRKGFFIVLLKNNRTYIHQNLPTNIWNNFKKASSKGSFYDKNIKKRFTLKIIK